VLAGEAVDSAAQFWATSESTSSTTNRTSRTRTRLGFGVRQQVLLATLRTQRRARLQRLMATALAQNAGEERRQRRPIRPRQSERSDRLHLVSPSRRNSPFLPDWHPDARSGSQRHRRDLSNSRRGQSAHVVCARVRVRVRTKPEGGQSTCCGCRRRRLDKRQAATNMNAHDSVIVTTTGSDVASGSGGPS